MRDGPAACRRLRRGRSAPLADGRARAPPRATAIQTWDWSGSGEASEAATAAKWLFQRFCRSRRTKSLEAFAGSLPALRPARRRPFAGDRTPEGGVDSVGNGIFASSTLHGLTYLQARITAACARSSRHGAAGWLPGGVRESTQSWRELLVDLKARGLAVAPQVAVGDGALGSGRRSTIFPTKRLGAQGGQSSTSRSG